MPNVDQSKAISAKHGDKMIEVRLRFFTDGIAKEDGKLIPKHAWDSGFIAMDSNPSQGIVPQPPLPFNSILQLQTVLAKVLVAHDVTLHANRSLQKLVQP